MGWLERINSVLTYVEENLDGEINMNKAAEIAGCSEFHFQRMFYMLTDVTVAEYIRKRRLTLAAQELATTEIKVIDLALKYGYDSPESFCKAFRKIHGISPSEARHSKTYLTAFPQMSVQVCLKGDEEIKYRIVTKDSFQIIGRGISVCMETKQEQINDFWEESLGNGFCNKLDTISGKLGKIAACIDFNPDKEQFTYFLGVEQTTGEFPEDFLVKEIPAISWAVFESRGPIPQSIERLRHRIYSEWFPSTGYEQAECTEFETFPPGSPDNIHYYSEIWIPIIKK